MEEVIIWETKEVLIFIEKYLIGALTMPVYL